MKILLVDDDFASRSVLSRFLVKLGHQIFECENGKEALLILKNEPVHAVFSDIHMPTMGGHELLKQIKRSGEFKNVIVVLFTGYGEVKSAVEAMRNGAYDYLLKPINIEELAAITERISEYLALKQENLLLTKNFEQKVQEATQDVKLELLETRKALAREVGTAGIGIFSDTLTDVFETAKRFHRNRYIPVLIEGETGTGKELVARFIHYGEGEIATPFIGINCAAISPTLFESELFGYEAGAFTGGNPKGQKGKLELASGGTLFLDEITELKPEFQAKLLRVIQEREYYRVGGLKKYSADVRFICATNQDIIRRVTEGSFREDLYYRLNVGYIRIPPLRERRKEILPLAQLFLTELSQQQRTQFNSISPAAGKILEDYPWRGNVRELKNAIERVALLWDDREVVPMHLDFLLHDNLSLHQFNTIQKEFTIENICLPDAGIELEQLILGIVRKALEKHQGKKTETARYLNISRSILYSYMKHL